MYKNRGNSDAKSSLRYFFFFLLFYRWFRRRIEEKTYSINRLALLKTRKKEISMEPQPESDLNPNWKIRGEISAWLKFRGFQDFRYNSSREMLGLAEARTRHIARQNGERIWISRDPRIGGSTAARSKFFTLRALRIRCSLRFYQFLSNAS